MKQPVVRSFLGAALVGMSALVSFGETYYWQGGDWGLYSEPANWLVGGPDGTAGAFAHVTVKCGHRTLKVTETPTADEGFVTCTAKPASGFQIIIR